MSDPSTPSPAESVPLSRFAPGERGRMVGFALPAEKSHRLLEMGFTPGTLVEVVRFAPMGDPIEVRVRGYHLSIRREEAAGILLTTGEKP